MRIVTPHLHAEQEATVIEALERQQANELVAFMGAGRLLSTIDPSRWAIATSSTHESALLKLTHTGLPIPTVLVTAADVSKGKPAPDAYLLAAQRLGVHAARCAVVDATFRGQGIGRALATALISAARALGYVQMRLDTGPRHIAAQGLYRSLSVPDIPPDRAVPEDLQAMFVFMELHL